MDVPLDPGCPAPTGQGRLVRSLGPGAVLLAPLAVLCVLAWLLSVRGPSWLDRHLDPDYQYLVCGLAIAEGHAPGHTDHPGTTVQLLAAGALRMIHPGGTAQDLAQDVFRAPERYLDVLVRIALGVLVAALAGLALAVWRATGSALAGLVAGCTPLLSSTAALEAIRFKPEPMLLALSAAYGACLAATVGHPERRGSPWLAAALGVVSAAAVVTKVTSLPLLLVPLIALEGRRARVVFAACAAAVGLALLAPALPTISNGLRLMAGIATHQGIYGQGAAEAMSWPRFLRALPGVVLADPVLPISLLVGGAAAALERRRPGRSAAGLGRSLGALLAAEVASVLFVARHPGPRYLLPALGLTGTTLAFAWVVFRAHLRRPGGACTRAVAAAVGLALTALVAWRASALASLHAQIATARDRQLDVVRIAGQLRPVRVIYSYRASSQAYALQFADDWNGNRHAALIHALYPEAAFFVRWTFETSFWDRRSPGPGARLLLRGEPLQKQHLAYLSPGAGAWRPVYSNGYETVYEWVPAPPQ